MLMAAHSCLGMDTHRFRNRYELFVDRFSNGLTFRIGKFFQVTDLLPLNQRLWCYHSDMYLKIACSSLAVKGSQHILQFLCKAMFFLNFVPPTPLACLIPHVSTTHMLFCLKGWLAQEHCYFSHNLVRKHFGIISKACNIACYSEYK